MKYKVLKHKTLESVYGVFFQSDESEIWHSSTPTLFGEATTIHYLKMMSVGSRAHDQLDDYYLVTVQLQIVS